MELAPFFYNYHINTPLVLNQFPPSSFLCGFSFIYHTMNKKAFIPAFGDWDYYYYNNSTTDGFPITQYFESSFHHHHHHPQHDLVSGGHAQEDLYVVGTDIDLYESDVHHYQKLHCNVVSTSPTKFHVQSYQNVEKQQKKKKKEDEEDWAYSPLKESSPTKKNNKQPHHHHFQPSRKVVDEDLYKISPHQLQRKAQRKMKIWGLFRRCLEPTTCL